MFPLFHIRALSFVFTCYCGAFLFDPVLTAPLLHLTDFGVMLKCGTCTSVHIYTFTWPFIFMARVMLFMYVSVTNITQEHYIHTQPSRKTILTPVYLYYYKWLYSLFPIAKLLMQVLCSWCTEMRQRKPCCPMRSPVWIQCGRFLFELSQKSSQWNFWTPQSVKSTYWRQPPAYSSSLKTFGEVHFLPSLR